MATFQPNWSGYTVPTQDEVLVVVRHISAGADDKSLERIYSLVLNGTTNELWMRHLNDQAVELDKARRVNNEVAEKYNKVSAIQRQTEIEIARVCERDLKKRRNNPSP